MSGAFRRIEIQITAPICSCREGNLRWGVTVEGGMFISCKTCGVQIKIPQDKFVASFKLDKPYPDGWANDIEPKKAKGPKRTGLVSDEVAKCCCWHADHGCLCPPDHDS